MERRDQTTQDEIDRRVAFYGFLLGAEGGITYLPPRVDPDEVVSLDVPEEDEDFLGS